MPEHPHHHVHDREQPNFDSPAMAAYAALEGEVLEGLATAAVSALDGLRAREGTAIRRVLDLGCGPGVGTCQLARAFPEARVVAVDGSPTMLAHATARAAGLGVGSRVETRLVDLAGSLAELGGADLVWVSMALHHVGDESSALTRIRGLLRPGGLLALIERAGPVRVRASDEGPDAVDAWERIDEAWEAWFTDMRAALPGSTPSPAYPAMLETAGLELVAERQLALELAPPLDDRAWRFARREQLARTRTVLEPYADAAALAALDGLLAEAAGPGALRRDDAALTATRRLYVARRR